MFALPNNLTQVIRRDPKKAAVLAVLTLVLGVVVVRHYAGLRGTAAGGTGLIALVTGSVSDATAGPSVPNLRRGARLSQQWRQSPVPSKIRNIFASDLNAPPARAAEPQAPAQPTFSEEDGLFWRQLERALTERADRDGFKGRLANSALADAGKLSVASIVSGPDSQALVSGRLVRVGDLIHTEDRKNGAFTVVAIEPRRVILARDSHRLALTMGKPGAQLTAGEE